MTISCRDTDGIPKVPGAGSIQPLGDHSVQVMHNGLKVKAGGYYGDWMAHIIRALGGHHEPQEELLFHHLLRYLRHGTTVVELGCFWAYYSLWYLKEIPGSRAFCVEPDPRNLAVGRLNADLNALTDRVRFKQAWVGGDAAAAHRAPTESAPEPLVLPVMNMGSVTEELGGGPIELLHMDVQGYELQFINSMRAAVEQKLLRFVMVSTHHSCISGSKTTHPDCVEALRQLGATILVEHDVIESFSGDGLILASFYAEDRLVSFPPISRNRAETSLFQTA